MGRGKRQSAAEAEAAAAAAALPKGAVVDASTNQIFVPRDPVSSDSDEAAAVQSTDTVAEVLAGNYSEGIVDEVRRDNSSDRDGCKREGGLKAYASLHYYLLLLVVGGASLLQLPHTPIPTSPLFPSPLPIQPNLHLGPQVCQG